MGPWKWIAFRWEDGKPPRANVLWGLASLSFPQESHHFQGPITLFRGTKPPLHVIQNLM